MLTAVITPRTWQHVVSQLRSLGNAVNGGKDLHFSSEKVGIGLNGQLHITQWPWPVHFLRPQAIIVAQAPSPEDDKGLQHAADRRGKLLGLWKATISDLERFWKIWTHDYLMSVRERHCMEHQQPSQVTDRAPLENEIVIVAEEGLPRAEWKLGKVEKLRKIHGGKTKAVNVKMSNGHVLMRPVNMLYPLEVSEKERET
uniref:DUF5641 domain-containing protein n=1 Tax=Parascaris univalens TaxID=6257 RepID=A0A915BU25_PARUN